MRNIFNRYCGVSLKNVPLRILIAPLGAFFVSISIILFMVFCSYSADNQIVVKKIDAALTSGTVKMLPAYNRDVQSGIDAWTDCLVLDIGTYSYMDFKDAAVSAKQTFREKGVHPCNNIENKVTLPAFERMTRDYWRYWWGSADLLRVVLGFSDVGLSSYQYILKGVSYFLVISVLVLAFFRYQRDALPFFPLAFGLLFGFGLPLFGQSIAHAPSLICGLLLAVLYMSAGIDRKTGGIHFFYMFCVGSLVYYYELLNGNLVATLVVFSLLRVISLHRLSSPAVGGTAWLKMWPVTLSFFNLVIPYVCGIVCMAFLRIVARAIVYKQNLIDTLREWAESLSAHTTNNALESNFWSQETKDLFLKFYYNTEVSTFPYIGRYLTVAVYLFGALLLLFLIVLSIQRISRKLMEQKEKDYILALFLIVSIIPAWYVVFIKHALIHSWMMSRLLTIFSALVFSIALVMSDRKSVRTPRGDPNSLTE